MQEQSFSPAAGPTSPPNERLFQGPGFGPFSAARRKEVKLCGIGLMTSTGNLTSARRRCSLFLAARYGHVLALPIAALS